MFDSVYICSHNQDSLLYHSAGQCCVVSRWIFVVMIEIHSSLIWRVSIWFSESLWSWPRFAPLLFSESWYESENLFVWMGQCLIQWILTFMNKICPSFISWMSVKISESLQSLPRFTLTFTESVFKSVNLLVWMGQCFIQWIIVFTTKIHVSRIQWISV